MKTNWTPERVALLRKLWFEGLSAAQIAKQLRRFAHTADGGRNAVIGKLHRLGLGDKDRPQASARLMRNRSRETAEGALV